MHSLTLVCHVLLLCVLTYIHMHKCYVSMKLIIFQLTLYSWHPSHAITVWVCTLYLLNWGAWLHTHTLYTCNSVSVNSFAVIILKEALLYFPVLACVDAPVRVLGYCIGFLYTLLLWVAAIACTWQNVIQLGYMRYIVKSTPVKVVDWLLSDY